MYFRKYVRCLYFFFFYKITRNIHVRQTNLYCFVRLQIGTECNFIAAGTFSMHREFIKGTVVSSSVHPLLERCRRIQISSLLSNRSSMVFIFFFTTRIVYSVSQSARQRYPQGWRRRRRPLSVPKGIINTIFNSCTLANVVIVVYS